jgi:hypothetical protein
MRIAPRRYPFLAPVQVRVVVVNHKDTMQICPAEPLRLLEQSASSANFRIIRVEAVVVISSLEAMPHLTLFVATD